MRLLESLTIRVKYNDLSRGEILLSNTKGGVARVTVLTKSLSKHLMRQLEAVRKLHQRDLAAGACVVALPWALGWKYPKAGREWACQWVFPASRRYAER
jgi:hypothetical protein